MQKKILGVALALIMLLTLAAPIAMAAGEGSITITNNNPNLSIVGKTFDVYKVFDVTYSGTAYSYTIASEFAAFATAYAAAHSGTTLLAAIEASTANSAALDAIATEIRTYILANAAAVATAKTTSDAATSQTVVIDDLDLGYYIIMGGADAADGDDITAACGLTTTNPDVTVNVKADAPTIEKKVWDVADTSVGETDDPEWQDVTDVNIGDVVSFLLSSKVPNTAHFTGDYTFIMHDVMSAGLTLDPDSFKVYVGGTLNATGGVDGGTLLTTGGATPDYTVNIPGIGTDTCTFEVDFHKIKSYTAGQTIYVIYEAELNEDAVIYDYGNPNKVNLEYSNDYNAGGDGTNTTPDDHVVVFTFDNDLLKFTEDDTVTEEPTDPDLDIGEKALAGAEFNLFKTPATDTSRVPLQFILETAGTATTPAVYRFKTAADGAATTSPTLVAPASGRIQIKGIDEGIYYLKETVAPTGYNLLTADIVIKIDVKYNFDEEDGYTGAADEGIDWDETDSNLTVDSETPVELGSTVKIENKSGSQLPGTGGIGTMVFTIAGIALMALAGAFLVIRKTRVSRKGA